MGAEEAERLLRRVAAGETGSTRWSVPRLPRTRPADPSAEGEAREQPTQRITPGRTAKRTKRLSRWLGRLGPTTNAASGSPAVRTLTSNPAEGRALRPWWWVAR